MYIGFHMRDYELQVFALNAIERHARSHVTANIVESDLYSVI